MKLVFNKGYFFFFVILFLVEAYIAIYINDQFVRPLLGDVLVVLLLYSFAKTFLEVRNDKVIALGVLLFAYLVELAQYFELVYLLGLADSKIATTIIGTSFDWRDLVAYTMGFILILVWISFLQRKAANASSLIAKES